MSDLLVFVLGLVLVLGISITKDGVGLDQEIIQFVMFFHVALTMFEKK